MSENDWHLFLDDFVLARSTGFDRVIHHPRCKGVVIEADQPWETNGVHPTYVERRADGKFICFYIAMWWDIDRAQTIKAENFRQDRPHQIFSAVAYAESEDGIHWRKPVLGLIEAPAGVDRQKHAPYPSPVGTTKENNLGVPFVIVADLHRHGNVTDPQKRYAIRVAPEYAGSFDVAAQDMPATSGGYFAAEIPDWINDPKWRDKLIYSGGDFNPRRHAVHYWDDLHKEWVSLDQGVWPYWLPSREIGRFASKDLIHWTSRSVLYPDSADRHDLECYDEPMMMLPWCAEGIVFGLLGWFHSDRSHPDAGPNLKPTPEHPFTWPWARKGTCEMRIATSRDGGITWDRTSSRQAWIPHGTEPASFDRTLAWGPPPVRVDDEDWFYIYACDQDHLNTRNNPDQTTYHHSGPSIRHTILYTQKHNRFVSIRARNQRSVLVTKPVAVNGGRLELNVDADRGRLRVGIAPGEAIPTYDGAVPSVAPHLLEQHLLPGFTFDDCRLVEANATQHEITFAGGSVESLLGRSVCLLFEMTEADLYGFRFA